MADFTHMTPANATRLLSTKTAALISVYDAIHGFLNSPTPRVVFTTKNTKLQIVQAIDNMLADAGFTYDDVEFQMQPTPATTEQNLALPQGDEGGPIYPTPTPAEEALAAATVKRLRKNGVSDDTIRSTLRNILSAPDTTEEDGTTAHGVATAAATILDTPATTRRAATRAPITPNENGRTALSPAATLLSAAPNPKMPGKTNHARYQSMLDNCTFPCTVADVLANSQATRGDLLWDIRHGFITLAVAE